jgi:hypothetical protein
MSTHKHTPGKWVADICKNNSALSSVHSFGEIPELMRPWNVAICTGPQAHSNARLIAAAPELLAALQLVYANAGESPEWIRARIGSVISKAEGVK